MAELTARPDRATAPMSRRRASPRRLAPLAVRPPVEAELGHVPAFDLTDRVADPLDSPTPWHVLRPAHHHLTRTTVDVDPLRCRPADMVAAIAEAGYTAHPEHP